MPDLAAPLAGREVVLDRSGALWLAAERTLVVADLHLEKASAYASRRRGLLPPYDSAATLRLLAAAIARRDPRRVICLGDSFHDDGGPARLPPVEREALGRLQSGLEWVWVAGNHDPAPPAGLAGEVAAEIVVGGLRFRHEPRAGAEPGEVAGHLHPAAKLRRHGRSVRRRAFATDGARMVLPAFGVLAGGLNVLDRAFLSLFPAIGFNALMIGERGIYALPSSALSPD